MGANSTQAVGLLIFLLAAVALAAGLALGGSFLLIVLTLVLLAVAVGILLQVKSRGPDEG
jgi:hypothetical protein